MSYKKGYDREMVPVLSFLLTFPNAGGSMKEGRKQKEGKGDEDRVQLTAQNTMSEGEIGGNKSRNEVAASYMSLKVGTSRLNLMS